jgi:hypothetical protein
LKHFEYNPIDLPKKIPLAVRIAGNTSPSKGEDNLVALISAWLIIKQATPLAMVPI